MTTQTHDRKRRRKGLVAWGALAGVAALLTTAAFTDQAFLNLGGANGIGGADSNYNIMVGGTDAEGNFVAGTWQEADDAAGVPILIEGSQSLFPGSAAISVDIPVLNESKHFTSSLAISLATLADVAPDQVTDASYLASLRFDVAMPANAAGAAAIATTDLTFDEVQALVLNNLAPEEESVVTVGIRLADQAETGAAYTDNELSGKGAFVQAVLDGSSV